MYLFNYSKVMMINKIWNGFITRLLIKVKQEVYKIILIWMIFCLGCASPQLASNVNGPDKSVEVAMISLGSYLIADRLKATSQDYRVPPY